MDKDDGIDGLYMVTDGWWWLMMLNTWLMMVNGLLTGFP